MKSFAGCHIVILHSE